MQRVVIAFVGITLSIGATYLSADPSSRLAAGSLAPAQRVSTQQASAGSVQQAPATATAHRAMLDAYCVTCHNERRKTAGLMLDSLDLEQVAQDAEVWEKVVRKLRMGTMPPAGMPRPAPAATQHIVNWLTTSLDDAAAAAPNPGAPVVHRLNRTEYTNAIRDLLGLEVDGASLLPADDLGYGFDNIGDVLTVSSGLLERYLSAAEKISRMAIGDPTMRPAVAVYKLSPLLLQDVRMSEDLPFGTRGGVALRHHFPLDGEYAVTIKPRLGGEQEIRGRDVANQLDVRIDGILVKRFTVDRWDPRAANGIRRDEDVDLSVRVPVKAGTRIVGIAFPRRSTMAREGVGPIRLPVTDSGSSRRLVTTEASKVEMSVERVEIGGPYDALRPTEGPTRRRLFVCTPTARADEPRCATRILSTLARRAYRRPPTAAEVETLFGFYQARRRDGGDFAAGIGAALERVLAGPEFLFRVERTPASAAPGDVYRISDLELASRLSFFLWSSIPDDELLALAERGTLNQPAVLGQQIQRMLADARAHALVRNFFGQWLYVRNMATVMPTATLFPDFDDSLRDAFQRETELFLESQVREDRPVIELWTANYTFVNERLAKHYEIPNVYGSRFRRVTLPDDRRAGLLGHGSILTVTSYANRTSPVVRGKWMLENLFGAPPPAPPPNVPLLEETPGKIQARSVRARLEQHRKNPPCAGCHAPMDPLGFALENFNAIGKWRATDGEDLIDASGVLPNGRRFDGPADFRRALLLDYRDEFIDTLTEKLLTYALGRGLEYSDMPAVRAITREAAVGEHRWSSLLSAIVTSTPFQMRKAP